jgi:hypothetical protein
LLGHLVALGACCCSTPAPRPPAWRGLWPRYSAPPRAVHLASAVMWGQQHSERRRPPWTPTLPLGTLRRPPPSPHPHPPRPSWQVSVRPFSTQEMNGLETGSLITLWITLMASILFWRISDVQGGGANAITGVVLLINFSMLAVFVAAIVRARRGCSRACVLRLLCAPCGGGALLGFALLSS